MSRERQGAQLPGGASQSADLRVDHANAKDQRLLGESGGQALHGGHAADRARRRSDERGVALLLQQVEAQQLARWCDLDLDHRPASLLEDAHVVGGGGEPYLHEPATEALEPGRIVPLGGVEAHVSSERGVAFGIVHLRLVYVGTSRITKERALVIGRLRGRAGIVTLRSRRRSPDAL